MSNAFTNFLSGVVGGVLDTGTTMHDYQHADRLYLQNNYARAPKMGFLYFVAFNFGDGVIRDATWAKTGKVDAGLLVKKIDLPKFKIATETLNQYNRKTVIQTKLNYDPVTIEFHDDNSEITNGLWKNYYKYYYTDSAYGGADDLTAPPKTKPNGILKTMFGGLASGMPGSKKIKGSAAQVTTPAAFDDTKYGNQDYAYGLDSFQVVPFFKSIDIYVLHQQEFTQMTLVNPIVTEWAHSSLDQEQSNKTLTNRMQVIYEDVLYNQGKIQTGNNAGVFQAAYYDHTPSPLSIGGKGTSSIFGPGGLIAGATDVFGENGAIAQGNYFAATLQAAQLLKNAKKLTTAGVVAEGYSIAAGTLKNISQGNNQPIPSNTSPGLGIVINNFAKSNSSVNGTTTTTPFKPGGGR